MSAGVELVFGPWGPRKLSSSLPALDTLLQWLAWNPILGLHFAHEQLKERKSMLGAKTPLTVHSWIAEKGEKG